jgi:ArsR family transcriptional regulator, arsenate/arsenite/antimonite-responsive transcriptional repressor
MKAKDIERISKALADPTRLTILQAVKKQGCMQCADIREMIDLAQPSISHHIKQLTDAGLLITKKEGRNMSYSIDNEVLNEYTDFLKSLGN